jgi:hypothetical protein
MFSVTTAISCKNTVFDGASPIMLPNGQSVAKYSPDGQLLWAKSIGHNIDGTILVRKGHLYFVGGSYSSGSTILGQSIPDTEANGLALFAAMDTSCASMQWMQVLGSSTSSAFGSPEFTADGGFLLSGYFRDNLFLASDTITSSSPSRKLFYMRTDSMGQEIWHQAMDASGWSNICLSQAADGTFNLAFTFEEPFTFNGQTITPAHALDYAVIRCAANGSPLGLVTNGPVLQGWIDMITMGDGSPVITCPFTGTIDFGNDLSLTGGGDVFVAKLGLITSVQSYAMPGGGGQLLIYANPNQGTCSIELPPELLHKQGLVLRILDAQGQVVQEGPLNITEGTVHLDIRAQAAGTYVAEVVSGNTRYTGRIVFE